MPEKLLDLKDLVSYLGLPEEQIKKLVDEHVIPAYSIGGSFLRFRKEQIDAIKEEILSKTPARIIPTYKVKVDLEKKEAKVEASETIGDKIADIIYFSDFYIICFLIIALMLYFIFKM